MAFKIISGVMLLVTLVSASIESAFEIAIGVDHYTDIMWSSVLGDYMSCFDVNHDTITVQMVTNTSGRSFEAHNRCVDPESSSQDVYDLVPAYAKDIDLHFKNKYCSRFIATHDYYIAGPNIFSLLIYWSIVVDLKCFQKHLDELWNETPYNRFLYHMLSSTSGCKVRYYPPLAHNTVLIGNMQDQQGCTEDIKAACDSIDQMEFPSNNDLNQKLCPICSWVLQRDACLDHLYIDETQLQTNVMLKPPNDYASVNKQENTQEWIPMARSFGTLQYIDPAKAVSGLIIDFWAKLLLWDGDGDVNDAELIAKLERDLYFTDSDMAIRIVDQSNTMSNVDTEYQEAIIEGLGTKLRCKITYMVIISTGFVDIEYVKALVKSIKTILRASNSFVINRNVTAHFTLNQPSCFPGNSVSKESDQTGTANLEYTNTVFTQLVALAIGFVVPISIVSIGLCISGIQDTNI